jgi:hypothetical protein
MALLWIDGFDGYGIGTGIIGPGYRYASASTSNDSIEAGYMTAYSLRQSSSSFAFRTPNLTQDPTLIAGCAFYVTTSASSRWINFYDNGTLGIGVEFYTVDPPLVRVRLGSTIINDTNLDFTIVANTWYYYEVKVFCHPTSGSVEVRIDGNTVVSLTGINTKAGTDSFHNNVLISLQYCNIDNYYICDGSGDTLNNFLGPCRVIGLFPNEDSTPLDWAPSTGTSHYTLIDEQYITSSDYLLSSTQGAVDYYKYPQIVGDATVLGFQISTTCCNSSGTSVVLQAPVEYNGQTELGPRTQVIGTAYTDIRHICVTDPDTGEPWTIDKLANMKVGIRII